MTEKSFFLEILTPERLFFSEEVEAVSITTVDGGYTILAGHSPITMPLVIGSIQMKQNGEWREAFQSEGFIEFDNNRAHVFLQACEWPDDIDEQRAKAAEQRLLERMMRQRSIIEYQWSRVALTRAMERLRIAHKKM